MGEDKRGVCNPLKVLFIELSGDLVIRLPKWDLGVGKVVLS